ncbi:N-acetyltransferase [Actinomadura rubrisoli]|uniref:N-acetyltransferase n=1 Tax=Actinomadura rubrisoli TaxID=2530368 RepID=A0A4R5ALP9_9ACTN|nr:N-acetyltransferase [Actinomadura rubrisoli]TDD73661.1 N-acetyltransferase [Actinomadura rubrisoli]
MVITTLAERPELAGAVWSMPDAWPEFVTRDLVAQAYFGALARTFPAFTLVATNEADEVVARAHSVPFALDVPGRGALPGTGWDQALVWAFADHREHTAPDTVSAIEIAVRPDCQGQGLSGTMLQAMRENAARVGGLVAPIRPTRKHLEPRTPMDEYARRVREDGLPADPWLRVHVRAGGTVDTIAPASMTVTGSLAQWRAWTGLPFDAPGQVDVPGALVPVRCVPEHDHAVYVEPNVWVRHS